MSQPGGRRRRPLYPMAWGAGTKAFEATYKCFSVAAAGREDLENGDKILMPEKAFREVSRLRLQFPLTMMAKNARKSGPPPQAIDRGGRRGTRGSRLNTKKSSEPFLQYCGVLEFSSPDGVCHLPHWMMQSLNLREGGRVTLRSAKPLPKGESAKFQPHTEEFLDFAMALGVRNVLELAMQHYSALAVGQTVLIQYGNDKYMLDVVEVSPGSAISLYGTVDLKVEFAPVAGSAETSLLQEKAVKQWIHSLHLLHHHVVVLHNEFGDQQHLQTRKIIEHGHVLACNDRVLALLPLHQKMLKRKRRMSKQQEDKMSKSWVHLPYLLILILPVRKWQNAVKINYQSLVRIIYSGLLHRQFFQRTELTTQQNHL
jgi:hypothetical protein